jgi:membrane associated rhomboid family serine protease
MDLNQIGAGLNREIEEHPDRAFAIKSLLLILIIIGARSYLGGEAFIYGISICFLYYLGFQCVCSGNGFFKTLWENVSILNVPRTTTKDRITGTAWVTWSIILINVFVFYYIETPENIQFLRNNLVCLPYMPNLVNAPISFLTSMYLHADFKHLLGNMTFLWAMGTLVERRIGWKQFLMAYHVTGMLGGALAVIIYGGILSEEVHGLGASGAVSGIMGVYIVRCYFKQMTLPLPLFGFLPINLNIRMNAFAVIGFFFALDLRGGLKDLLSISTSRTSYWDHLACIAVGLWIACRMKLADKAIVERHQELGSSLVDGKVIITKAFYEVGGFANAEKSLLIAIGKDAQNPDTFLALARLRSNLKPTEEGGDYYLKALRILVEENSPKITSVFREYFRSYHKTVTPESQYQIASLLYREGDFDLASRTLEMLVELEDTPEPLREKSMLLVARLLEKLTFTEAAQGYYQRFVRCYPASDHVSSAQLRLELLKGI